MILSGERLHAMPLPLDETFSASTCKKSCKFLEGKSKHKKTEKTADPDLFLGAIEVVHGIKSYASLRQ